MLRRSQQAPSTFQVLGDLALHPVEVIVCRWNWKSAGRDFAQAVREVLSNPAAARTRVENARRIAARLDWRNVARQFFDTYETFHSTPLSDAIANPHVAEAPGIWQ